jgi:hypothetical protein
VKYRQDIGEGVDQLRGFPSLEVAFFGSFPNICMTVRRSARS